jgi:uncharacterized protein (TIGR03118 family)
VLIQFNESLMKGIPKMTNRVWRIGSVVSMAAVTAVAITLRARPALSLDVGHHSTYVRTDMVSDNTANVPAAVQDKRLVNAWGLVSAPTSPFWINDNNSGLSTLYAYDLATGLVDPLPAPSVVIPPPSNEPGAQAAPTGIVFNPANILAPGPHAFDGDIFIFDTEDGTLSGWQLTFGDNAEMRVDNKAAPNGPVYKGLALGVDHGNTELFATNFRSGQIDVFDVNYNKVLLSPSAFTDPGLPAGYAPFGIANIDNLLYVTYALQNSKKHDDVKGPGHGFVDVFATDGHMTRRFATRGTLDSPWGVVKTPDKGFGSASAHILIGNFGDGGINVFDHSGGWDGFLKDGNGDSIAPDHLWSLSFGNDSLAGPSTTLFFTAGPNDESDGLFGKIEVVKKMDKGHGDDD